MLCCCWAGLAEKDILRYVPRVGRQQACRAAARGARPPPSPRAQSRCEISNLACRVARLLVWSSQARTERARAGSIASASRFGAIVQR